ncbi:MAG TPA: phage protein Gp36 family protein [Nitrospira sp.]|nr:phage protein Gp36 family protein [Nitrospira sp.]
MTYAAPSDIRDAVAPDGSVTGTCGELDDDQLQGYIQRSQDLVDGYTATPFFDWNVPNLIKDLVIQLATFYATLAYRKGKELNAMHPVYLGYQDAQRTLTGIKSGTIEFEPPQPAPDGTPRRRRPKVNNAWRSSAELFPLSEFGMRVRSGEDDNEGYKVTQDPNLSNTGYA